MTDADADAVDDSEPDDDDDVLVLPWWRNPVTIVSAVVGLVLLSAAGGYVIGNNAAMPDANRTDVGFLQDMRVHHEQAVALSYAYLNDSDVEPALRTVAGDDPARAAARDRTDDPAPARLRRIRGQRDRRRQSWMDDPARSSEMPGLASEEDLRSVCATRTGASRAHCSSS